MKDVINRVSFPEQSSGAVAIAPSDRVLQAARTRPPRVLAVASALALVIRFAGV